MAVRASDVFVGRARELGELERALDAARAGTGTAVLIAGDAGIGKTRLVSELGRRARDAGFAVLLGRAIDLVGPELPFQPLTEALRPLTKGPPTAGTRLKLFEDTLTLLTEHAKQQPLTLVLEDLHWADVSTLDFVVFLAHNLDDRRILVLATYRPDDPPSTDRVHRFVDGVRRSGAGIRLALGPLRDQELATLLAARADERLSAAQTTAIVARCEGNPFFAEELLSASGDLPAALRDVLLRRVARLDRPAQDLLRLAAAAGRDVGYPLLEAVAVDARESLRQAIDHGVLVADQATGRFRFRHALLAEAVYGTILPGEREELHARLAEELARTGAAPPAELAPHWAAAGRAREALTASLAAAPQAEAVFGLAEALGHLERALAVWDAVPDAAQLAGLDLAGLCAWAAELASRTGAAPRAVELVERAIALVGEPDPLRAANLLDRLGRYLHESGRTDDAIAAYKRAATLVPAEPPSVERAQVLAALGGGLLLAWQHDRSLAICTEAAAVARTVGAHDAELASLLGRGATLAYLGHAEDGLAQLREALERADDPLVRLRAYILLTDALLMLGRPRESARVGEAGLAAVGHYGIDRTVLVCNTIEALFAAGDWDRADSASAAALRAMSANFPYMLLMNLADIETGRGRFDQARAHLDAARTSLRADRGFGIYDVYLAELALWERRWTDADEAVRAGLELARTRHTAQIRVWLCAKGLRAQAELAALARARGADPQPDRARALITIARRAAATASAITPTAGGWLALAEAEYARAGGHARADLWSAAASTWDQLERPPAAAYCRLREAEALVLTGAPRSASTGPLQQAYAVATRIGAEPLRRELELLAQRARLDVATPAPATAEARRGLAEALGLTGREAEVLGLVARGYSNREIAATLVISIKTASVHVSHILQKLGVATRVEAAAIVHKLEP